VGRDGEIVSVEGSDADARVVREAWNRVVGFWNGVTFTKSEPRTTETSRAVPHLGWEPGPVQVASAWAGNCKGRCVALTLALTPDPARVLDFFQRLQASAPELGGTVASASLSESLALRTDPETLLPIHRLDTLRVAVEMADPPGKATRTV
jgi:hypothetical protein